MSAYLNTAAEFFALRLFDSLIEGGTICACAALIVRVVPRQSAATRFAVWFSGLVAVAVLPWVSGVWLQSGTARTASSNTGIALPESWAIYFLVSWGLVALWFSLRVGRALWHLNALRRCCITVDPLELSPILRQTLQRHGGKRRIALCTSEHVRVPTAIGLVKPAILIPRHLMHELTTAELNQVVLHELAHFRRWDDWTNLVQQVVAALLFFHPAIWWIGKKLGLEREMACDDAVLAQTASPRSYAECLARLAEKSLASRTMALAQSVLGKVRQTSARVARILDVNRPAPARYASQLGVSLVAVFAIACALVYSRSPKLVAFDSSPQTQVQSQVRSEMYANASLSAIGSMASAELTPRLAATPAKVTERVVSHKTPRVAKIAAPGPKAAHARQEPLVHFTGSRSVTVPFAETFWVIVESNSSGPMPQQVYQIQMWRVTVLRSVTTTAAPPIPPKET